MKKVLGLILITMLLAACAPSAPSTDDTAVQTAVAALLTQQAPAPEATEAPAEEAPAQTSDPGSLLPTAESIPGLPAEASCVPLGTDRSVGTVVEIYTGDSIVVRVDGKDYGVRYIGIDDGDSPQALEANRALIENQQVTLVRDEADTDEYGRYLRYVMVGDTFVNLRLLQQGVVGASPEAPNTACERLFNSVP